MDEIVTNFLIASANPRELSEFYALVCNGKAIKGFNPSHFLIMYRQNYKIQIYKPSAEFIKPSGGLPALSICFQKQSNPEPFLKLKEWCEEIVKLGAVVYREPQNEFFGAEVWMSDPEGNIFLLLVPLLRSKDQ
tara:strand:- start:129 stop:530 length:402 start_codon:yes stop_codon:yes gene_type:complete